MSQLTDVMELYTAYFNRAADKGGVDYWLNEMNSNGWSLNDVAVTFSQTSEYANMYGGMNYGQIVDQVYQNVLNRTPDNGGKDYWVGQLNSGNISTSQLILAVINAAKEDVDNLGDDDILSNKSAVSQHCYDNNINRTDISLETVTTDSSSVSSLIATTYETIDFTQDMLANKTLYPVMVDKLYDYSEKGVAFTFSENSLTDGIDTVGYEIVDGVVVLPEDGGSENHWILTEVTDTYYEFHGSVNSEISGNSYADRLYFNEADALEYYDSLLGVFEFSMDWLNGKTLYNVFDDDNNGTAETMDTINFNDGTLTAIADWHNDGSFSTDYNVVGDGILYLGAPSAEGTPSYIKAFETENENVWELIWGDTLDEVSTVSQPYSSPNYFILDQNTATEFLDIA